MAEVFFCWGGQIYDDIEEVRRGLVSATANNAAEQLAADPLDDGGRGLQVRGGQWIKMRADDPGDNWALHFGALWVGGSPTAANRERVFVGDNDSQSVSLRVSATEQAYDVLRQDEVVYTETLPHLLIAAHYCLRVTEHPSAGSWELYRDGVVVASETNVDTSRSGSRENVTLAGGSSSVARRIVYSHIILADQYLGRFARVTYAPVTSDETPNDFTRTDTTKDHFEHLDQAPHDGEDDYLRSDAFGTETAHRAAVSLAGRNVVAVQPVAMARLEEQGGDELEVEVESGSESSGRVSMGPVNTVGYTLLRGPILSEDPDTSEPWTQAALSDAKITLEHVAPGS